MAGTTYFGGAYFGQAFMPQPVTPVVTAGGAGRWLREYLINFYTAEFAKKDAAKRTKKKAPLAVPTPIDITAETEPDLDALEDAIHQLTQSASTVIAKAASIQATQLLERSATRPDGLKAKLAAVQHAARLRYEAEEAEYEDDLLLAAHVL